MHGSAHVTFKVFDAMNDLAKLIVAPIGLTLFLLTSSWTSSLCAQDFEFSQSDFDYFENKIRPLLTEHCLQCHGNDEKKVRGGLRLTSREEMLTGGDSGPAVVPGDLEESLLISAVHFDEFDMPPKGKLASEQITALEKWVEMGAPDPRNNTSPQAVQNIDIEAGKDFWAFQPIPDQVPSPPGELEDSSWAKTEIDAFILRQLKKNGLSPVDDVDRSSLLRRVYLTLSGLPPDEETIEQFANSENDLDIDLTNVVDKLLGSTHFGERWGRHWLDVARFAESSGGGRSLMFPHAWRYRDYVIQSFNKDKPFDQFIREQIAGDLLPFESHDERSEYLIATGYLALGPTNYEQQDKELLNMEVIDEQVDTIGRSFLALTLGCARCHDHKFDPIPTKDYYAMAGIFKNTKSLVDGNVSKYVEQSLATNAEKTARDKHKAKVAKLTEELKQANKLVESLGAVTESPSPRSTRKAIAADQLPGIVIDNSQAKLTGDWTQSVYVEQFVADNYIHDDKQPKGQNTAVYSPELTTGGQYEVRMSYSAGGNRASNVPVSIHHQDGVAVKKVNQSQKPDIDGLFVSLGTYRFEANNVASVTISNEATDGVVIADAVQFLHQGEATLAAKSEPSGNQAVQEVRDDEVPDQNNRLSPELVAAKAKYNDLNRRLTQLKKNAPSPSSVAMSVKEVKTPKDGHIHIRGSVRNLGDVVPRGFIQVVCDESTPKIPANASGRLQLANWIAASNHPLTSRVYVNRVWRHLFGRGLVETTDNFGKMGQLPSHPELLDYLARRFTDEGWSTKKLVREIVLSRTFRLDTQDVETNKAVDPENRLLWRANRRRMDAEVLRDSILVVSGALDLTQGGLTIRKLEQYDLNYTFETSRRSVYVPAFRNSMMELFEVFDVANPNLVVGHRNTSTLPTQALFLMNSPWVMQQSRLAAKRLLAEKEGESVESKIQIAYLRVIGRAPTHEELQLSQEYLSSFQQSEEDAWSNFFHALIASLDFRYMN